MNTCTRLLFSIAASWIFPTPRMRHPTWLLARGVFCRPDTAPSQLCQCSGARGQLAENQLEILKTFPNKAVIAIENTRVLKELRQRTSDLTESLAQQTATSDVLQVISSSPGELQPVFEAMLAKATDLCEAFFGALWLREGDELRVVAFHGSLPSEFTEQWKLGSVPSQDRDLPLTRAIHSGKPVHVIDLRDEPGYRQGHPLVVRGADIAGIRTLIAVPMLKEDEFVGVIAIYRREVRAFTDKQIALVTNFAAQAVIAIENTRLLNEPCQ